MAQIITDPERMRDFANKLQMYCGEIAGLKAGLQTGLPRLAETWRDQEFQKFSQAAAVLFKQLDGFLTEMPRTHTAILAHAQALEPYSGISPD